MSSDATSLEKAARAVQSDAVDGGSLLGADTSPEQLDAFRDEQGALPKNVFQLARQQEGEGKRGPGRPAGSRNKRSDDLARLVAHKYGDPVEFMASLYHRPTDQIVELLKIADPGKDSKRGDIAVKALNIQLSAAKGVAEYVHSKKPTEHVIDNRADAVIVMPGVGGGSFEQLDEDTREASKIIAAALSSGAITAQDLIGMKLVEGQLVEGEYTEVGADDDADDDGDDAPGGDA